MLTSLRKPGYVLFGVRFFVVVVFTGEENYRYCQDDKYQIWTEVISWFRETIVHTEYEQILQVGFI